MIAAREMGQPYPSGMDTSRSDSPIHDRQPALSQPVKPYSQNWRERRQKARVRAAADELADRF